MSLFARQIRDVRRAERKRKREKKLKPWERKYKRRVGKGVYEVTEYAPKKTRSKRGKRQ